MASRSSTEARKQYADSAVQSIAGDISKISSGLCLNRTICN